ncbi:MAG: S-methyl-5'-thioadenosine phosphorylase [Candidatus Poribacteria bacterium]|nr:S-methyl-5'-thioadenosine phosphorylase [Candidatus Poribacteria bacterium]
MSIKIGVIGGSGFYQMEGLSDIEEINLDTPFGKPSDSLILGTIEEKRVVFLPRHGVGHRLLPSEINVRANIYALKSLGVEWIISVSAVGSLKSEIEPRHFVVPDQLYDHTKNRISTFFGEGLSAHVSLAHPFCPVLSELIYEGGTSVGVTTHKGGTYICMEGPAFSTQAESNVYRHLGFDVIGMTAATEAKLAREAEICYATLACSTDYDCWHPDHDNVTAEMILQHLLANVETAKEAAKAIIRRIPDERTGCACPTALEKSIATNQTLIPDATRRKLDLLIGKYMA